MIRRLINNQWSGGIAAHPAPKFPSAKIRWKSSRLNYFGDQNDILLIGYLQKGQTINAEYYLYLLVQFKDILNEKTPWEGHQGSLVLARQCPGSLDTCNPEATGLHGLPVSCLPTIFSRSGPIGLPPVPWTEKKLKGRHFSSDAEVIAAAETCLDGQISEFLEWLAKVIATG